MSAMDRAAQFSPFSALTGYEAVLQEAGRLTDSRAELTEYSRDILDQKQQILLDAAPAGEAFDWRIVIVHVQAMQLMLSLPDGEAGEAARSRVLAGLDDMLRVKLQPSS